MHRTIGTEAGIALAAALSVFVNRAGHRLTMLRTIVTGTRVPFTTTITVFVNRTGHGGVVGN